MGTAQGIGGVGWRSTLACLVGSLGLSGIGLLTSVGLSKSIGDMGTMSFDTSGSRAGLAVAATGFVLFLAALLTLLQRMRLGGILLAALATLVAMGLFVSAPAVYAVGRYSPVAHHITCSESALQQALTPWPESDLPVSDAMRQCRTESRIRVAAGASGAIAVWILAFAKLRRRQPDSVDRPTQLAP